MRKGDQKVTKKHVFRANNDQKGCILATFRAGFGRLFSGFGRDLRDSKPLLAEGGQKVTKRVLENAPHRPQSGRLGPPNKTESVSGKPVKNPLLGSRKAPRRPYGPPRRVRLLTLGNIGLFWPELAVTGKAGKSRLSPPRKTPEKAGFGRLLRFRWAL